MKLRLATRGSALALAQSGQVAQLLRDAGNEVELVTVRTSGDDLPQEKWATEGNKGLFVKEIEEALLSGAAEFAVHSAKDMPAVLPAGLSVAAFPRREDPRDVLVTTHPHPASLSGVSTSLQGREGSLEALAQGACVGSASERRRIQLLSRRPDLKVAPVRGNIDTRLRKLGEKQCDALLLAASGLKRLGAGAGFTVTPIEPFVMVPAPGQGALALEARSDRADVIQALQVLEHTPTRKAVECERVYMAEMGGGCRMPLGALADVYGNDIRLSVFFASAGQERGVRLGGAGKIEDAHALARDLAAQTRKAV